MQLDFLWQELQGYSGVVTALKAAKSVLEASNAVLLQYERPADQSETVQAKRAGFGQAYYNKYAPAPTSTGLMLDEAVKIFVQAGIMASPEYWTANASKLTYLPELLVKTAAWIKSKQ